MKKIVALVLCAATLAACNNLSGNKELTAENDSLKVALSQRDAELDEMIQSSAALSEGFRQINEAENRVDLQRGAVAEGSKSAKEQITADIQSSAASGQQRTDSQAATDAEGQPLQLGTAEESRRDLDSGADRKDPTHRRTAKRAGRKEHPHTGTGCRCVGTHRHTRRTDRRERSQGQGSGRTGRNSSTRPGSCSAPRRN